MSDVQLSRGQRGSAFILALIVIMLLTIMGLSLSVVTQTEMQLGVTEKTVERQEYAAELGMWTKVAQMLLNDCSRQRLVLPEEDDTGNVLPLKKIGYAIETTAAFAMADRCPALTDCGEDQGTQQFLALFVLLGATAKRVGYPEALDTPFDTASPGRWAFGGGIDELGQATVSMGFFGSPIRPFSPECAESAINDSSGVRIGP